MVDSVINLGYINPTDKTQATFWRQFVAEIRGKFYRVTIFNRIVPGHPFMCYSISEWCDDVAPTDDEIAHWQHWTHFGKGVVLESVRHAYDSALWSIREVHSHK